MKLDLINRNLYTDSGNFIKRLHCPLKVSYTQLEQVSRDKMNCRACRKDILETANLEDRDLLEIVKNDPDKCISIDLNQSNLIII